ncbi:protein translocase subunit SecF [Nocardioides sp. P86]|uniref:protein translocase subunit SecF n=1 Tax=Nocardioides sp. P86 TaxID=2939569 RepID=UPI00203DE69D|nr:protein translocase subunit SecF [Nocardioides sp. P86]MCM3513713.1 protein translocase subunit SecF [Nocardioides sp. P86]
MGTFSRLGNDLYGGRKSIDFVNKRGPWYLVSVLLVAAAIAIVLLRGLNFGVEFTGGTQFDVDVAASSATQDTADELRQEIADSGIEAAGTPTVTTSSRDALIVQTENLSNADNDAILQIIDDVTGASGDAISQTEIGPSWGQQVAQRAVLGVVIFLILVVLFIWAYFREWKMSVAALVALFHDIAITIGIYALSGFPVTPSAVTGLLAILGFSLYDTVVVFDKVRENTTSAELRRTRYTYAEAANLAVNQTLVRSINTAIVALIPIGAILYVSTVQLGASSLQDLALSQFVGMAVGVYSSIFLAPRLLVHMKSSETEVKLEEKRAKARARAMADPYATVPSFAEDMPVEDEPGTDPADRPVVDRDRPQIAGNAPRTAPPRASEAVGRGRVVPPSRGPVADSRAAGRQQPSRQTRSKRGKK